MKTFKVEIVERYTREFHVEAETREHAEEVAMEKYENNEFQVTDSDFVGADVEVFGN
jgi:hypothetical protein